MVLGMDAGLGPGHIVLDEGPAPLVKRDQIPHFWPIFRRPLSALSGPVWPSVTFVHCGQTVGRIKTKLGTQVGLGPGHIVLDGDPAPLP